MPILLLISGPMIAVAGSMILLVVWLVLASLRARRQRFRAERERAELMNELEAAHAELVMEMAGGSVSDIHTTTTTRRLNAEADRLANATAIQQTLGNAALFLQALDITTCVSVSDSKGRMIFVNDLFCALSGYTREELLGEHYLFLSRAESDQREDVNDATSPDSSGLDRTANRANVCETMVTDGRVWRGEMANRARHGDVFWTDTAVVPVHDEAGALAQIVTLRNDVTARVRAEDSLRIEGQFLQTLMDNIPDTIYFKDTECRFTRVNNHLAARRGLTPEMVVGKTDFDFFDDVHAMQTFEDEQHIIVTGEPMLSKVENPKQDGNTDRWVLATKVPIKDKHGRVTGLVGTSRDISAMVHAERELIAANAEAIASVKRKSQFLASMSHEIRTPMNGVIGITGLLLDTTLDEVQRDYVETIRTSSDALLRIINDILDFSKVEAGKLELEEEEFDLRTLVEGVCDLLVESVKSKNVELAIQLAPALGGNWLGDPGRIRQILINILGNAVKFVERGEVVLTIDSGNADASAANISFIVRDTGPGMPVHVVERLFQPFVQSDDSSSQQRSAGTGLGLAISKQLAELMGGDISVTSQIGVGTSFTVKIELKRATASTQAVTNDIEVRHLNLLIVDDCESSRIGIQQQLTSLGMRSAVAADAAQALRLLQDAIDADASFDFVLIDRQMPGTDGIELAREIRTRDEIAGTRLILLEGSIRRMQHPELEQMGFEACLSKPVKQSALFDCLAGTVYSERNLADKGRDVAPPALVSETASVLQAGAAPSDLRILVADDNAVNQKVALNLLQRLGFEAKAVYSGRAAVDEITSGRFSMVLMDCQMPDMDGYEATAVIRARKLPVEPVVIAMTAHALAGEKAKCLAAGMDDYLSKPVNREQLKGLLDHWSKVLKERQAAQGPGMLELMRLDKQHLWDISLGDPETVAEIVALVVSEQQKGILKAHETIADEDLNAITALAHSCAGASANCGMQRLRAEWNLLEKLANEAASSASMLAQLAQIREQFALVEVELESMMNEVRLVKEETAA